MSSSPRRSRSRGRKGSSRPTTTDTDGRGARMDDYKTMNDNDDDDSYFNRDRKYLSPPRDAFHDEEDHTGSRKRDKDYRYDDPNNDDNNNNNDLPNRPTTGNLTSLFRRQSKTTSQGRKTTTMTTTTTSTAPGNNTNTTPSRSKADRRETSTTSTPTQGGPRSPRRIAPLSSPDVPNRGTAPTNRIIYSTSHDEDDDEYDRRRSNNDNTTNNDNDTYDDTASREQQTTASGTHYSSSVGGTTATSGTSNQRSVTSSQGGGGAGGPIGTILRYRGFSTSIQNLFLDEALVCASMGCFGLILSNRTEFLLQLRNDRRGVRWGRSTSARTLPSRLVAYALLLTLMCIMITFVIWGFGNGGSSSSNSMGEGWYKGYGTDDGYNGGANNNQNDGTAAAGDDDANSNNNNKNWWNYNKNYVNYGQNNAKYKNENWYYYGEGGGDDDANRALEAFQVDSETFESSSFFTTTTHSINGIFKLRDMHEGVWVPIMDSLETLKGEWDHYQEQQQEDYRRLDHNGGPWIRGLENDADGQQQDDQQQQPQHSSSRNLASDVRVAFMITFMIVLGLLGRRRRMRTRYYLVRARAQEDHLFYASAGAGVRRVAFHDSREDQYEGACSHTLCGCYPIDPPKDGDEIDDNVQVDDDGVVQHKKAPQDHDCISLAFNCLMSCCCGILCRCWCQCLSICALAQEAREIRLLVPTRYQRVDYLTHQPFHEYHKMVNELRRGWLGKSNLKTGILIHFQALSQLSRYILVGFFSCFVTIVLTLMFNPRASFSWPDLIILIATFVQSFLVIFFVHWIFHKSDLSLDAVIKFFAAGFLIAVPAAFFFEGMLVNISLTTAYTAYALGVKISEGFITWVADNYKWMWILAELCNAYIVAAITEELCKYYAFRCVEHPDLIFLTGLARSSQDERAVAGGMVKYPFGANQLEETNKRDAYDEDDERSVHTRGSHRSTGRRSRSSNSTGNSRNIDPNPFPVDEEYLDEEQDIRTHRQKAMAVTTGMISVAVGLACAENFLYVFLLGGSEANAGDVQSGGVIEEWIVLLFRSLFPIHALAAAMQSIAVIRKYIECDTDYTRRIGVYRIIFPAVIMHGSFDAVLLGINIYMETSWDAYLKENEGNLDPDHPPYDPFVVNLVAWLSLIGIMFSGLFWYFRENRQQRERLIVLEEKEKGTLMNTDSTYRVPSMTTTTTTVASSGKHQSEVELV